MTEALKIATENLDQNQKHIQQLEDMFFTEINKTKIEYKLNGSPRLNGFINITFNNYDGQSLLMNLDMNGIAISYGSACSSGSAKPSAALLETGMTEKDAKNTIRISIGKFINKEDIQFLVKTLNKIICNSEVKAHV